MLFTGPQLGFVSESYVSMPELQAGFLEPDLDAQVAVAGWAEEQIRQPYVIALDRNGGVARNQNE